MTRGGAHALEVYLLVRDTDVSGVSGLGAVAECVVFSDGTTVLRWLRAGWGRASAPATRPATPTGGASGTCTALVRMYSRRVRR